MSSLNDISSFKPNSPPPEIKTILLMCGHFSRSMQIAQVVELNFQG